MLLISSRKFTHLSDSLFSLDLSTFDLKSQCFHPDSATFQSESRCFRRRARVFMCFSFLHIANLRKNPEESVFPSGFYDNLRKSCGSAASCHFICRPFPGFEERGRAEPSAVAEAPPSCFLCLKGREGL